MENYLKTLTGFVLERKLLISSGDIVLNLIFNCSFITNSSGCALILSLL